MTEPQSYHYAVIGRAIDHIAARAPAQASLDEVAASVGMSPAHFQRVLQARIDAHADARVDRARFVRRLVDTTGELRRRDATIAEACRVRRTYQVPTLENLRFVGARCE